MSQTGSDPPFLEPGDVVLRPEGAPFLFLRVIDRGPVMGEFHEFLDLETGSLRRISSPQIEWFAERRKWEVLKRSHPAMPSGSVDSDHSNREGCEPRTQS